MNSTKFQLAAYRIAQGRGTTPDKLTAGEYTRAALAARGIGEKAKDGIKAGLSLGKKRLGISVPLPVYQARAKGCDGCSKCHKTEDGGRLCTICGCCGELMEAALYDATEACRKPPGQRVWDKYRGPDNPGVTLNA